MQLQSQLCYSLPNALSAQLNQNQSQSQEIIQPHDGQNDNLQNIYQMHQPQRQQQQIIYQARLGNNSNEVPTISSTNSSQNSQPLPQPNALINPALIQPHSSQHNHSHTQQFIIPQSYQFHTTQQQAKNDQQLTHRIHHRHVFPQVNSVPHSSACNTNNSHILTKYTAVTPTAHTKNGSTQIHPPSNIYSSSYTGNVLLPMSLPTYNQSEKQQLQYTTSSIDNQQTAVSTYGSQQVHFNIPTENESMLRSQITHAHANQALQPVRNRSMAAKMPRFPYLLYQILMDADVDDANGSFSDIVSWLPHGRAFIIKDISKFETVVMPKYFSNSKWTSFRR